MPGNRMEALMLQALVTMIFLGSGMFSLAVIAAMLMDYDRQILRALGLIAPAMAHLPRPAARIRIVRSPRMMPMSPVPLREAA